MAQLWVSAFVIQSGQFAGTLTDFPVKIIVTDNRFRTVGNSGFVADANGYDLRAYSDAACTVPIPYKLVPGTYNATAGTFEMDVLVASAASGSAIYIGYGDAALNTDGSSDSTWNSGYKGEWALPNGTSLTALDGTSNNNDGTVTAATAVTGQVDGAAGFNGTTADIACGTGGALNITTLPMTVEFWIKKTTAASGGAVIAKNDNSFGYCVTIENSGTRVNFIKGSLINVPFAGVIPSNTNWHYVAITVSGSAPGMDIYVNPTTNAPTANNADTQAIITDVASQFRIGYSSQFGSRFDGAIDEVRVSNVLRSGDWILASYNNQKAPTSFWTLAAQQAISGGTPAIIGKTVGSNIGSLYEDGYEYNESVQLGAAGPGIIPFGHKTGQITNPYRQELDHNFPVPTISVKGKSGSNIGLPRDFYSTLGLQALLGQLEINNFQSMYGMRLSTPHIGTIPPPPPAGNVIKAGFVGVGAGNRRG